jgi:hypothetical protein
MEIVDADSTLIGHPFKSTFRPDSIGTAESNLVLDIDEATGVINEDGATAITAMLWLSPTSTGETAADRGLVMVHRNTSARAEIISGKDTIESRIIDSGLIGVGTTLGFSKKASLAQRGRTRRAGTNSRLEAADVIGGGIAETSNSRGSWEIWNGLDNRALAVEGL